jgi:hypothetical protein
MTSPFNIMTKVGQTQTEQAFHIIQRHPFITSMEISQRLELPPKGAAAVCSALHKAGRIRAESIWVRVNPQAPHPVLHYFTGSMNE